MKVYSDWREYLYQCLYDYLIVEGITKIASESVDSVYTSKYERNYLSLTFNYNNSNGELTLLNVEETYKSRSKDISRIIRGEKLKRLTLLNENII